MDDKINLCLVVRVRHHEKEQRPFVSTCLQASLEELLVSFEVERGKESLVVGDCLAAVKVLLLEPSRCNGATESKRPADRRPNRCDY